VADENNVELQEGGVNVPYQQIDRETLLRMIQEFVSRDGADWGDAGCTLDDKVDQVFQQLQHKQVKIVFDLHSQTVNIVACR
jgi:uncharacterized protein YheU (UPF0270 family)